MPKLTSVWKQLCLSIHAYTYVTYGFIVLYRSKEFLGQLVAQRQASHLRCQRLTRKPRPLLWIWCPMDHPVAPTCCQHTSWHNSTVEVLKTLISWPDQVAVNEIKPNQMQINKICLCLTINNSNNKRLNLVPTISCRCITMHQPNHNIQPTPAVL